MTEPRRVARPRVLSLGFLTAFFGLSLLFALAIVMRADGWWRFLLLVLPLVFGAATAREALLAAKSPDEPVP